MVANNYDFGMKSSNKCFYDPSTKFKLIKMNWELDDVEISYFFEILKKTIAFIGQKRE